MRYISAMAAIYEKYNEKNNTGNKILANVRPEILKLRFLELFAMTGNVSKSCDILGMVRRTVSHWRKNDPQFAKDFEEADKEALSLLEDEATRRAMMGIDKPVYQAGKLVGFTKEYSDQLLIVLLKARSRKYIDKFAGELTGADGKPLALENKIIHVHSPIPLANSEDEIDLKRTEDATFQIIPDAPQGLTVPLAIQKDNDFLEELS